MVMAGGEGIRIAEILGIPESRVELRGLCLRGRRRAATFLLITLPSSAGENIGRRLVLLVPSRGGRSHGFESLTRQGEGTWVAVEFADIEKGTTWLLSSQGRSRRKLRHARCHSRPFYVWRAGTTVGAYCSIYPRRAIPWCATRRIPPLRAGDRPQDLLPSVLCDQLAEAVHSANASGKRDDSRDRRFIQIGRALCSPPCFLVMEL